MGRVTPNNSAVLDIKGKTQKGHILILKDSKLQGKELVQTTCNLHSENLAFSTIYVKESISIFAKDKSVINLLGDCPSITLELFKNEAKLIRKQN